MVAMLHPPSEHPARGMSSWHHRSLMNRVQELIENGFPWMTFPADLERQFQNDGALARRRHFILSGLISLLVYNGFLLVDHLMAADVFWIAVELRVLVFTPISLLFLYLFAKGQLPFQRQAPPALVDALALLGGVGAALSLGIIIAISHSPLIHFYHVGFMVVITYGNVVQRLRFWFATAFTVLLLAVHVVGVLLLSDFPPRLLWPISSMVVSVAVFTLCANYFMERDERRRYLRTLRERGLVRDLTEAHARLKDITRVDPLTHLHNRRHIQEHLALLWERAWRDRSHLSVLLVDIDHFKKFNDRYGHHAGDECLQRVARVLQENLRRHGELVARYAGEQFMAVLPNTDAAFASGIAERVRQAVESLQIRHESSTTALHVTVGVGVVSCLAHAGMDADQLISLSEQALQKAKEEGRNRVCSFTL